MRGFRDEILVGVDALAFPAEAEAAAGGGVGPVDAPENGAGVVVFGEEDVDEGDVRVFVRELVFRLGEDGGGEDADRFGGAGGGAGFAAPLRGDGFAEDVEHVDQWGGSGGGG